MPSPLTFFPVDCGPAPAAPSPASSVDQSAADFSVSFDAVLNQAAPSTNKAPSSAPATASAEQSLAAGKSSQSAAEAADLTETDAKKPEPLTPEELAALLALMGAPLVQQSPLPFRAPIDPSLSNESSSLAAGGSSADLCDTAVTSERTASGNNPAPIAAETPSTKANASAPTFTLDAASTDAGLTARDLLKQGAEIIDYQLTPAPQPASPADVVTEKSSPAASAPISSGEASDSNPAQPVQTNAAAQSSLIPRQAQEAAAGSAIAAADAKSTSAATGVASRRSVNAKGASQSSAEKFAASGEDASARQPSGVNSSIVDIKNKFLNVADEDVAGKQPKLGTDAANWGDSMNLSSQSMSSAARFSGEGVSVLGASSMGSQSQVTAEVAAPKTAPEAQAAQMVREIRDIADGLWAVERNSVEVRFQFSDTERLSVKVEYRDGVVQTTFRTDSPGLRDTIAREWQSQVASASEARPYRVADPVFNTPPADARGFSLGGDSSRQQRQAEQSGNAPHTFATTSGRGQSSSSIAAAPVAAFTRPDTALHLHAFA